MIQHCGEKGHDGWGSKQVLVNTIHHDEIGHYEQKLVKDGYWE